MDSSRTNAPGLPWVTEMHRLQARSCVSLKQHELTLCGGRALPQRVALGLKLPLTVSQQIRLSLGAHSSVAPICDIVGRPAGVVKFAGCAGGTLGVAFGIAGRSVTGHA